MLLDQVRSVPDNLCIQHWISRRVVERRDWDAPTALPRDAPVGARFYRRFDTVSSPLRDPLNLLNRFERLLAKSFSHRACHGSAGRMRLRSADYFGRVIRVGRHVVNSDKPLVHGAKHHGRFAAPAERISVMIILL